ncbi:MAG: hypothetical protein RL557_338 [archaeon]|jgi:phosphate uptake regulator
MKRRLIKQGVGALTITVPKDWISRYGLKAGDEVEMNEVEKTLIVRAEGTSGVLRKKTIDIDHLSQTLLWRYIMAAYRAGYDEITIKFSNSEKKYDIKLSSLAALEKKMKMNTLEVIQDAVNRFIGLEIIDHGENYCVINSLGEISEKEFSITLRRIFLLLLSMAEESLAGLEGKTKNRGHIIASTDVNVDKFADFCLRALHKRGYEKLDKTSVMYSIILLLEFIGDEYKKIAAHVNNSKIKYDSALITIHERINNLLNLFYGLFYSFDEKKANELYEKDEQLTEKMNAARFNKEGSELVHHLKKIKRYITDLMQLRIDLEM